jgi:hypothetical protein
LAGDVRHDSMGHSAKYGTYTIFCCTIGLIINIVLVQVCKNATFLCNDILATLCPHILLGNSDRLRFGQMHMYKPKLWFGMYGE